MSKVKDADQPDPTPVGNETPPENPIPDIPGSDKKNETGLCTIEEYAKNLNIDRPTFAAVMQSENWAGGKKVPEAVFKKAVDGFLNAPMGGKK